MAKRQIYYSQSRWLVGQLVSNPDGTFYFAPINGVAFARQDKATEWVQKETRYLISQLKEAGNHGYEIVKVRWAKMNGEFYAERITYKNDNDQILTRTIQAICYTEYEPVFE